MRIDMYISDQDDIAFLGHSQPGMELFRLSDAFFDCVSQLWHHPQDMEGALSERVVELAATA